MANEIYVISDNKRMFTIRVEDIIRIEADGTCTIFYCRNKAKYYVCKYLKIVLSKLDTEKIIKIHKSHAVNIREIKSYEKARGGNVIMSNGDLVPVSQGEKRNFLKHYCNN